MKYLVSGRTASVQKVPVGEILMTSMMGLINKPDGDDFMGVLSLRTTDVAVVATKNSFYECNLAEIYREAIGMLVAGKVPAHKIEFMAFQMAQEMERLCHDLPVNTTARRKNGEILI